MVRLLGAVVLCAACSPTGIVMPVARDRGGRLNGTPHRDTEPSGDAGRTTDSETSPNPAGDTGPDGGEMPAPMGGGTPAPT